MLVSYERPFDRCIKPGPGEGLYYDMERLVADPDGQTLFMVVEAADGGLVACGYAQHRRSARYRAHSMHGYLGFMLVVPEHRGNGLNRMVIGPQPATPGARGSRCTWRCTPRTPRPSGPTARRASGRCFSRCNERQRVSRSAPSKGAGGGG